MRPVPPVARDRFRADDQLRTSNLKLRARTNDLSVILHDLARSFAYFGIELSDRLLGFATANRIGEGFCELAVTLKLGLVVGFELEQRVEST